MLDCMPGLPKLEQESRRAAGRIHQPSDGIIRPMTITYKDAQGIAGMRVAGRLASEVLYFLTPHVKTGITTDALD